MRSRRLQGVAMSNDDTSVYAQDALQRLWEVLVDHEISSAGAAHIVVYHSPRTGVTDYTGPFANALDAMVAAAELETMTDQDECASYSIARLNPW